MGRCAQVDWFPLLVDYIDGRKVQDETDEFMYMYLHKCESPRILKLSRRRVYRLE